MWLKDRTWGWIHSAAEILKLLITREEDSLPLLHKISHLGKCTACTKVITRNSVIPQVREEWCLFLRITASRQPIRARTILNICCLLFFRKIAHSQPLRKQEDSPIALKMQKSRTCISQVLTLRDGFIERWMIHRCQHASAKVSKKHQNKRSESKVRCVTRISFNSGQKPPYVLTERKNESRAQAKELEHLFTVRKQMIPGPRGRLVEFEREKGSWK